MKLPRTMSEALKLGYVVNGHTGQASHEETKEKGCYCVVKEGSPQLLVPYKSTIKFGRPRRFSWKRWRRA